MRWLATGGTGRRTSCCAFGGMLDEEKRRNRDEEHFDDFLLSSIGSRRRRRGRQNRRRLAKSTNRDLCVTTTRKCRKIYTRPSSTRSPTPLLTGSSSTSWAPRQSSWHSPRSTTFRQVVFASQRIRGGTAQHASAKGEPRGTTRRTHSRGQSSLSHPIICGTASAVSAGPIRSAASSPLQTTRDRSSNTSVRSDPQQLASPSPRAPPAPSYAVSSPA